MSPSVSATRDKREFATELKFLLDPAVADSIRAWARERLVADPHAQGFAGDTYNITSLYFDTAALDVFHRRGLHRHSKFRVRRYGDGSLFLERKLKVRGRLAKHRTPLSPAELERWAEVPHDLAPANRWFQQRVAARQLQPWCQIDYRRMARVLMSPAGPIRLTLDESIGARPARSVRFDDTSPTQRVTDRVVLELKFRRDLPALFRDLVATFALNPVSFSKYRAALPLLGLVPSPAPLSPEEKLPVCQTS